MELDKLIGLIASTLHLVNEEININTTLREELGADSLDLYQIAMAVEREFDIELEPEAMGKVITVGDALELIKNAKRK
ncbi:MAG: acyl carrier protein [Lachnospiraceae bacterium]|nr:acyl carrier protein [Candidatus Merdinaster equi]